uniref:TniQ family protein n=1 Tax=Cryobacterium sp. TaxID=1926290 RepID=UPI0015EF1577|nr:TniQ family protein [Cryobacterium sp.]
MHPAPIDGEVLSSWLHRIAACYSTDLNLLGDDIGFTLGRSAPDDIDVAPPHGMIDVLTERTGVTPDRLRQMSVAGWVPWLLDTLEPVPDGFDTYTRQLSVLRPGGKQKTREVPWWRPWLLSPRLPSRACPDCVAATPSPQPYLLLWAIPIVSSCPVHGCWLEDTLAARGRFTVWEFDPPTPRPAPGHILTLDQRTHDAFAAGHVELPRRRVHAGIWFRLLRTIIDELSCPLSENRKAVSDLIRQIWAEAGYRARDGQSLWYPYEQQPEMVQRHTMEAAATAVMLLENSAITGSGSDAALFLPSPHSVISDGTPPPPPSPKIGERPSLRVAFNAAVEAARINPAEARTLFDLATYKRNGADDIHGVVNAFIELGIPLDFHHASSIANLCNTQNK